MFFFFFVIFHEAQKQICLCNNECSLYCPENQFVFDSAKSSFIPFQNFFRSVAKDDTELEVLLYSSTDNFAFDFDPQKFTNVSITVKTLFDSKAVTLNVIKAGHTKAVLLSPKEEITFPPSVFPMSAKKGQSKIPKDQADFFQNKHLTGKDITETIVLGPDSAVKEVVDCTFSDLSKSIKTLFLIQTQAYFDNITFDMDNPSLPVNVDTSGPCVIRNCIFNKLTGGPANAITATANECNILIENCQFNVLTAGNIIFISITSGQSSLIVYNCSFSNDGNQETAKFLYSRSENVTIDSCHFSQTNGDDKNQAIRIDPSTNTTSVFTFINNDVYNPTNRFLGMVKAY